MTAPRAWSRHYQDFWLERTYDRSLPNWLRVACLAYGTHRRNGHANLAPGTIGLMLGRVDECTGEIRPADKNNVQRAIKHAIAAGWLAAGSGSLCLVVPGHAVAGGGKGDPDEPCQRHDRDRQRKGKRRTLRVVS